MTSERIPHETIDKGIGLNFGVDYLGYKNDMKTTHSDYIISIKNEENPIISLNEIIRIGRISANTNKSGIILNNKNEGIKITWCLRQKIIPN